jgi:2-dehydropantoate 2-reductase
MHKEQVMRICVIGAGSIGGYLAVHLAQAWHEVSVVARGPNLQAIRKNGLRLLSADGEELVARDLNATDRIETLGKQDIVILAVKAHQIAPIAGELAHLFHADSALVPMQNGIPWWYFQREGGALDGHCVESVDPRCVIAKAIDPRHIVGCVAYPAAKLETPGVIRHIEGNRLPVGALDGSESKAALMVSDAFMSAGLKSPVLTNIRAEIWLKLCGTLSFNPISALTHSTLVDLCQFPPSRDLAQHMMQEAAAVASSLGIELRVPLEKRLAGAERVGKHKTSMLQDVEAGRDPEIDALVGSVIELGRLTNTPTPSISAVYALMKLLSKTITDEQICVKAAPRPLAAA